MKEKICNSEQLCYARKLKFYDGREKGENVIIVENGCLNFTVLQDRGFDIYDLRYKGTNISFLNKGGICGFDSDFNTLFNGGMLYTCGLDSLGRRTGYATHGKIHNIPATLKSIESNAEGVELKAIIRDSSLFGDHLQLERTISCKYNSSILNIKNKLTNLGFKPSEYCLLFHINLGYPMLDEGVEIDAPIINTTCNLSDSEKRKLRCCEMEKPLAFAVEECFYHNLSKGVVNIINKKIGKRVTIRYDEKILPYLVEWKSMVSGDYALGIEPSTAPLDSRFFYNSINPGEDVNFDLSIEIKDI